MRFLKPLLAGATLIALAAPALASAEPYYGDRGGQDYHSDGGYHSDRHNHRGDHGYRDSHRSHWRTHYRWERYGRGW